MSLFHGDDEEERTVTAVALIVSAANDADFTPSLREIHQEICTSTHLLDPLNMLPSLFRSSDPAASDLLVLMSECASAKEVVIATQEAVEKLKHHIASDELYDAEKPNAQLLTLVQLYSAAIPRIKHRKKAPQDTLRPIVMDLTSTMSYAGSHASTDEGRAFIAACAHFVRVVQSWALSKPDSSPDDRPTLQALLKSLLDSTVEAYSRCIRSSLADRTFTKCYPRLSFKVKLEPDWERGDEAITDALSAYNALGVIPDFLVAFPSACHFVLVAHTKDDSIKSVSTLSSMLSVILGFIQANNALDETISFLLETLHANKTILSPEVSIPLCTVLPTLASGHPSPSIRHQAFRILSKLLSSTDAAMRVQILEDLCSSSDFPQMRVAAVGLVKEAIIEAFNSDAPSLFTSPRFLQVLGPTLFRPQPLEFFESQMTLEKLQESSEPARLVECLGLLYVLVLRDQKNKTGIRDKDNVKNIQRQLLSPIKTMVDTMFNDPEIQKEHAHDIIPLVSLQTILERVENTLIEHNLIQ